MNKYSNGLRNTIYLVLGNSIMAFGVVYFILPNHILSGGIAGIAVALSPVLNIEPQLIMYIMIVLTYILGLIFLGKMFAIKTLASSIMYPILISVFEKVLVPTPVDPLMASIYGGLLTGIGLGVTFKAGASTGGMDIPPLILSKFTSTRVSIWILIFDALTVLLGFSTYGLESVLIGFISVFAATFAVDKIGTIGGEQAKQVFIVSNYSNEILKHIHAVIERGSTIIEAKGGYTGDKKDIIMTILMVEQYPELESYVKSIDPEAFLIVSNVTEVHGNGFYKI